MSVSSSPAECAGPVASVIIPLFNNAATIEACLQSVRSQTIAEKLEIIVVDDGSTDDSVDRIEKHGIRVICQANAGPAAARNAGAANARGNIFLFLDADCVAPPDWVERTIETMNSSAAVAAMAMIRTELDHPVARLTQMEIDERYRLLKREQTIDFIAAPACACRRSEFVELGGFDAAYRFNEDVELAYRLNRLGKSIVLVPDVWVLHPHPISWRIYFLTKFHRGVWRMWLYRRYPLKSVADSWTPQSLKAQILFLYCTLASLVIAPFWRPALGIAIAALILFLCVAWPLVREARIHLRGRAAVVSIGYGFAFVAVRAFAQGAAVLISYLKSPPIEVRRDAL